MCAPWVKGPRLVDVPYRGHVVRMDVSDLVGWHFFMLRNFDPEVTEIIERFSVGDERDVFWDIGANKGACSYEIATSLPRARIVAVEPQRGMQTLLTKNLRSVAPGRHEIFPVAIGVVAGSADIFIPEGNRGAASMVADHRSAAVATEKVEVTTCDAIRQRSRYGWPTIVKIDVEGYEPAVIQSLEPAFASGSIRCCVFECHASESAGFKTIVRCTQAHGYRVHAIRKSPFATHLAAAASLVQGATDYAIVRSDLC